MTQACRLAAAPFDATQAKQYQEQWASRLQDPVELTNSIGMKFRMVPPGEFLMGTTAGDVEQMLGVFSDATKQDFDDEQSQHLVRITQPFYLGVHEVTVGQLRKFVNDGGYKTEAERSEIGGWGFSESTGKWEQGKQYTWQNPGFSQEDDHPVVNVSWNDSVAFCEWLSGKENATYRLPTEAEWEYACRAGTTTWYVSGNDPESLAQVGNVGDETLKAKVPNRVTIRARDGYVCTAPMGQFQANAFGLHDMHGNVCEWCADWYANDYYADSASDDPKGPPSGSHRVHRGGSWDFRPRDCRSSSRLRYSPVGQFFILGFRLVRGSSGQ